MTWSPASVDSVPAPDEGIGVSRTSASADSGPAEDADMDDVFTLPPLPAGKRGSTFRSATWMTKVDRLTRQLEVQEKIAAAAGSLAASLQGGAEASATHMDLPPLGKTPAPLGTPPAGLERTGVPSTGATKRSTLLSDLATLRRDAQGGGNSAQPSNGTPFSAADSALDISLMMNTVPNRPLALSSSTFTPPLHNAIPTNAIDSIQGTTMVSSSHRILPGSPGKFWYLQVGFDYLEGQDSKTTMLFGLSTLMEILPDTIDSFTLHPLNTASTLPPLTNTKPDDGFPSLAVLVFKYFLVKNKNNSRGAPQALPSPPKPSPHRHRYNDEEEYRAPTTLWGVIKCTCNGNIKEGVEGLAWDIGNTGITIKYKEHQSPDSSAQILLMNVPVVFDRNGVEGEIIWHIAEIEKSLLKKGVLSSESIGTPLPEIKVSWRQNKQGKGKTKAEKDLSLNNLVQFQENGCLVCTVEAAEGPWGRLGPLWEAFHRTGMSRRALGRSTLMVVMFNGRPNDNNRITMQRLRRVNVVHGYIFSSSTLPHVVTVHKQVKIEMEDGSKHPA